MKPALSPPPASATVEPTSDSSAATTTLPEESTDPPVIAPVAPIAPDPPPIPPQARTESSEPPPASPAATTELLHESFADVAGTIRWTRDGVKSTEGPPGTRVVYFFNGMPEGGPLVMRSVEDNATLGPDEQPGVLALSWQEIPAKLPYSGFTFLGRTSDRLTLPPLKLVKAAEELGPFRLKFRHKAVNESRTEPFSLAVGCRFEPLLGDSYAKRIDLGTFTATGEWGSFEKSFAEGENTEAFLAAIANENPGAFKIVWSQSGPLADYRAGDTLLIDDIVITGPASE